MLQEFNEIRQFFKCVVVLLFTSFFFSFPSFFFLSRNIPFLSFHTGDKQIQPDSSLDTNSRGKDKSILVPRDSWFYNKYRSSQQLPLCRCISFLIKSIWLYEISVEKYIFFLRIFLCSCLEKRYGNFQWKNQKNDNLKFKIDIIKN